MHKVLCKNIYDFFYDSQNSKKKVINKRLFDFYDCGSKVISGNKCAWTIERKKGKCTFFIIWGFPLATCMIFLQKFHPHLLVLMFWNVPVSKILKNMQYLQVFINRFLSFNKCRRTRTVKVIFLQFFKSEQKRTEYGTVQARYKQLLLLLWSICLNT